jgi:hypothetical protein
LARQAKNIPKNGRSNEMAFLIAPWTLEVYMELGLLLRFFDTKLFCKFFKIFVTKNPQPLLIRIGSFNFPPKSDQF